MHRALAVPELMHQIVDEVDRRQPRHMPTLLAVAFTCHTFLEPALDIIWSVQNGFGHLVRCLPKEFWTRQDSPSALILKEPSRPTTLRDWERFDFYARRVRELTCSPRYDLPYRSISVSTDLFFWLLSSRPGHQMLPNLSKLDWTDLTKSGYFGCANLLFCQQLSRLGIEASSPVSSTAISPTLLRLPQCLPDIEELAIHFIEDPADVPHEEYVPSEVFTSLRRLKLLSLVSSLPMSLSHGDFAKLAALPHLTHLMLSTADDPLLVTSPPSTDQNATPGLVFHTLQSLTLSSLSMASSIAVMSICRFPRLRKVDISSLSAETPTTLDSILRLVHERCPHVALEELEVSTGQLADVEEEGAEVVPIASLRRLCDFHQLHRFSLSTEMCIVLDNDFVKEFAVSWPRLEYLQFFSTAPDPWTHPTATTLEGLAHLARYCPSLEKLTIDVDTSSTNVSREAKPGGGYSNQTLRTIDFGQSRAIGHPMKIAAFLFALFPNVQDVNEENDTFVGESWQLVRDVVAILQTASRWHQNAVAQKTRHDTQESVTTSSVS
ncbi:hypothetical protein DAEQUDRAFT_755160 [Daedalea quercina L-15889]|uniref:F-box domain-containing protein n=1 Tax=Daedalea quercina L-15889 TaxID=1314783 RepID=A0A165SPM5_9APHY|nr:hypothetical protein DAEQUDRAFT_755160 [Daedalea quercina L-15889]